MGPIEVVIAVAILSATIGVGITIHELSHAAVLRFLGVPYEIRWLPETEEGRFHSAVTASWATVTPQQIPDDVSSYGIRLAAIAPLALTLPVVLGAAGILPNPLASGDAYGAAVTIAWLGCALPSPQDFSVFWYADRALA
ncbi:hypothetical protein [Halobacteriaceae bacterium SHR40]|uniref:hypothetical protein n=1 Tax=Halovenus amylolytica TaxID=2500550 RepID=UPI000FE2FEAD